MTTSRTYRGTEDFRALSAFASAATRRALPAKSDWHPGDVAWQLAPVDTAERNDAIRLWSRGGDVVGVAWSEEAYTRVVALDRTDAELIDEMLAASEARAAPELAITVAFDDDAERTRVLERRGYRRFDRGAVHLERDLRAPIERVEPPHGFRFIDAGEFDVDRRVALHVDAWSHLEHLGLVATSSFDRMRYRRMAATPAYRNELDIVLVAEDGTYVSGATCWIDPASGVGLTEPVGTRFDSRGRGFSRAVNLEGVRRMQALGMHTAVIQTADFNLAAQATYRSCGYTIVTRDYWWAKRT